MCGKKSEGHREAKATGKSKDLEAVGNESLPGWRNVWLCYYSVARPGGLFNLVQLGADPPHSLTHPSPLPLCLAKLPFYHKGFP